MAVIATFRNKIAFQVTTASQVIFRNGKLDLIAIMTILLFLSYAHTSWYVRIPISIIAGVAFIYSPLRTRAAFWLIITSILIFGSYQRWYAIDNHKYLMTYWSLAIFCSLLTDDPEKSLAFNGRLLIGLSFLFAVFWKVTSLEFMDSTFFQYALLVDDRFSGVATLLGNLSDNFIDINNNARLTLMNYANSLKSVQLETTPRIRDLAIALTWWTILIETLIFIAFLLPVGKFISKWRDYFLIVFIVSTYLIAPVIGFGWLLVVMGIAQSSDRSGRVQLLYILSFLVLQIYRFPWGILF